MSNRWKLWVGVSAMAIVGGALPTGSIVSPMTSGLLSGGAWAQESGEGEGAATECTTESGEGEEGGAECPTEESTGEDGEGEGS